MQGSDTKLRAFLPSSTLNKSRKGIKIAIHIYNFSDQVLINQDWYFKCQHNLIKCRLIALLMDDKEI